jgi:uncharacterized phage protein (TIGR02220 family)
MATPRKAWLKCPDSVGKEPWNNDVLATAIRLQCEMNTRWARDGLSAREAAITVLRPVDLMAITGARSVAKAKRTLGHLCELVTISAEQVGENFKISWPKWPIFQGLAARDEGDSREEVARQSPPPQTQTQTPTQTQTLPHTPTPTQTNDARERERASRRDAGSRASNGRDDRDESDLAIEAAYEEVRAAFAEYGKQLSATRHTGASEIIRARLADGYSAKDLVHAVHGYAFKHENPGEFFDPEKYRTPKTILSAENIDDYLDNWRESQSQGLEPPFGY